MGMGQRNILIPLATFVAAVVSVWITDFKGWVGLNKKVADWAAVGAFLVCLPGALRLERLGIISAVAAFLALVQIIHLFRHKDVTAYWHLVRFSMLQVIVAGLLAQDVLFGAMLILYLFTAIGAMSLLFLHSEWGRHHRRMSFEPAANAAASRWPLAGQQATFAGSSTGRAPLGREFFGRLTKIGLATLLISVVVFIAVPRLGRGAWRGVGGIARSTVGFTDKVRLGELGKVIQNPEEVLRVSFRHGNTHAPYAVDGDVFLRGAVLVDYHRGEWRPPPGAADGTPSDFRFQSQDVREAPVRQRITIEPLDRDELFCVWPFDFCERDHRLEYFPSTQRLVRTSELRGERISFELGTTAFVRGEQVALTPAEETVDPEPLLQMPFYRGKSTVPGLTDLARRWLEPTGIAESDHFNRASVLERQLRDSGRFSYSLEGQPRERSIDPIEDFITKHPRGHCEYFATALCLMLRSQGIPARVVVGYRTGEYSSIGGYFQVRQLHAHTWVEAYIAPAKLPVDRIGDRPSWAWLTRGRVAAAGRHPGRRRAVVDHCPARPYRRLVRADQLCLDQLHHGDGPAASAAGDLRPAGRPGPEDHEFSNRSQLVEAVVAEPGRSLGAGAVANRPALLVLVARPGVGGPPGVGDGPRLPRSEGVLPAVDSPDRPVAGAGASFVAGPRGILSPLGEPSGAARDGPPSLPDSPRVRAGGWPAAGRPDGPRAAACAPRSGGRGLLSRSFRGAGPGRIPGRGGRTGIGRHGARPERSREAAACRFLTTATILAGRRGRSFVGICCRLRDGRGL